MPSNRQVSLSREPYSEEKYVTRLEVEAVLAELAKRLHVMDRRIAQVQVFQGTKGAGKSWLALHLHRTWQPASNTRSFLLSFDSKRRADFNQKNDEYCFEVQSLKDEDEREEVVMEILRKLLSGISAMKPPKNATLHELRSWFAREGAKITHRPLLFIIDGLYEAEGEFLKLLESHVLRSIIEWPHAILILMAQGRDVPWSTPELRPDREKRNDLKPFEENDVKEQIRLQEKAALRFAPLIKEFGGGAPLNTLFLARFAARAAFERTPSEQQWSKALEELVAHLLEENDATPLSKELEALSVLNGFREDISEPIWNEYQEATGISPASPLPKWKAFVDSGLVRWWADPARVNSRYMMDDSVREPVEWQLFLTKPRLWARLHCRAEQEFQGRAQGTAPMIEFYGKRAEYHRDALGSTELCELLADSSVVDDTLVKSIRKLSPKGELLQKLESTPAGRDEVGSKAVPDSAAMSKNLPPKARDAMCDPDKLRVSRSFNRLSATEENVLSKPERRSATRQ